MSLDNLFLSIFDNSTQSVIPLWNFILCISFSLLGGFFISLSYTYKAKYTKSFVITLATLPSVVCVVIMMVNGNLGAGIAVAGTFSLVRFRSAPGTAKEIGAIFLAMGSGLIMGMGYLGYGVLFTLILGSVSMFYNKSKMGNSKNTNRTMKITIPEDLDYSNIFDDLFSKYTRECELINVKTTNLGSLFRLTYDITLHNASEEKQFIDDIRCRNGNLEIIMARQSSVADDL